MKKITKIAWAKVIEVACDIANASEAGDDVLVTAHTEKLFAVLDELEEEFGEHPELYDTRADFTDDPEERMRLYKYALQLAVTIDDQVVKAEIQESISRHLQ
ncbi:hypothetical protein OAB00_01435 [Akkermansiaceae bacterium]|nr:hypothetical protein [Akkermansiaceae bacterium]